MKYSEYSDTELFAKALDEAGYSDLSPIEENIIECFMDYVDTGAWENMFIQDGELCCDDYDAEEITPRSMAIALIKLR